MFDFDLNVDQFVKKTEELGAAYDQLPFVLASLLNDAAFAARRVLVETTWPSHVTQRNKAFISASLRVQKAEKQNLSVHIYDVLKRGHLKEHATGGVTVPFRARKFAIPMPGQIRRTSRGVASNQTPTALIARTPKRALRVTSRGIFVAEHGRLHLKYSLKPTVNQPKDVPFFEDFEYSIRAEMRTGFADKMAMAMATRR